MSNCKLCFVGMDQVRTQKVILAANMRRGKGVVGDPIRIITQVFCENGHLIAETDTDNSTRN